MNAFCNCPLNPVFQGPMVATAWLRNMQKIAAARMSKTATPAEIMIYFHVFPEVPLLEGFWLSVFPGEPGEWTGCLLEFELLGWAGEGCGAGGGDFFFFSFGTAGKAPLLRIVGRAMIGPEGDDPSLAGAAARLLDCSSSLRRAKLTSFWAIWTMCGSDEPA